MEYFFLPLVAHVQADTYTLRSGKWCSYSVFLISMDLIWYNKVKLFTCCLQMCQRGNGRLLSILTVWQKEEWEIRSLFVLLLEGKLKKPAVCSSGWPSLHITAEWEFAFITFFSHFHCFLSVPVDLQCESSLVQISWKEPSIHPSIRSSCSGSRRCRSLSQLP